MQGNRPPYLPPPQQYQSSAFGVGVGGALALLLLSGILRFSKVFWHLDDVDALMVYVLRLGSENGLFSA